MSARPQVQATALPGVLLLSLTAHRDERGFFVEAFNARTFGGTGIPLTFVQDNHSRSRHGVLRGLHFQGQQGKLVRVAHGKIFDVAVDVRPDSPTYRQWVGVTLDDVSMMALWIPPGFAHGFCALSDEADVLYKCTELYDSAAEKGIAWNDPEIGIDWPLPSPLVSGRDLSLPLLSEVKDLPRLQR